MRSGSSCSTCLRLIDHLLELLTRNHSIIAPRAAGRPAAPPRAASRWVRYALSLPQRYNPAAASFLGTNDPCRSHGWWFVSHGWAMCLCERQWVRLRHVSHLMRLAWHHFTMILTEVMGAATQGFVSHGWARCLCGRGMAAACFTLDASCVASLHWALRRKQRRNAGILRRDAAQVSECLVSKSLQVNRNTSILIQVSLLLGRNASLEVRIHPSSVTRKYVTFMLVKTRASHFHPRNSVSD